MIKNLFVFVEEQSAKHILDKLLPKIVGTAVSFRVFPHQGKQDLEKALCTTLPSLSKVPNSRIVITRDKDSAECMELKKRLNVIVSKNCHAPYIVRIVCNELENWILGDLDAIKQAFPRFNKSKYEQKADFKNVDSIQNASILLKNIIPEYSMYKYLPKIECSENISRFLDVNKNKSESFNQFVKGVKRLIETE